MEANRVPSGLNILAGIWLIISPYVLGFAGTVGSATTNNVIVGIAVLVLAALAGWAGQRAWASWVNLVLGIWTLITPWLLGFSAYGAPTANNVILGIIVGVLALWAIYGQPAALRTATFQSAEPEDRDRRL